jgi:hypothetical protein
MKRLGRFVCTLVAATWLGVGSPASAQQAAQATATLVNGFVVGVTLTDGGSGYAYPPRVSFVGSCVNAAGAYATISNGAVTAVTVTNAGYSYAGVPVVLIAALPPFADALVLDLPQDGTVADAGPNHLTVIAHGGTFVASRHAQTNSALALNGVNQYLEIPFNALLYPDEMTLSLWVKFPQFSGTVWRAGDAAADGWRGFGVDVMNAQGQLRYTDFNGSTYNAGVVAPEGQLTIGEWRHVTVTRTVDTAAIFVNGVKVDSQTGLTAYTKPRVRAMLLGANYNFVSAPFQFCNFTLDTVHIYNRALSDAEVQSLYQAELPRDIPILEISAPTSQSVRVTMQVVPGQTYGLESSTDLESWGPEGSAFVATAATRTQDFAVTPGAKFFRLVKLP